MNKDYYAVLGVSRDASVVDIRKAFRKIASEHHPDVAKDKKTSNAIIIAANEAYGVLSEPAKRRDYDQQLLTMQVEDLDETVKKAVVSYLDGLTSAVQPTNQPPTPTKSNS